MSPLSLTSSFDSIHEQDLVILSDWNAFFHPCSLKWFRLIIDFIGTSLKLINETLETFIPFFINFKKIVSFYLSLFVYMCYRIQIWFDCVFLLLQMKLTLLLFKWKLKNSITSKLALACNSLSGEIKRERAGRKRKRESNKLILNEILQ